MFFFFLAPGEREAKRPDLVICSHLNLSRNTPVIPAFMLFVSAGRLPLIVNFVRYELAGEGGAGLRMNTPPSHVFFFLSLR